MSTQKRKLHIEPFLWALFGLGGTVAAVILPTLILVFGILAPLGFFEPLEIYENLKEFSSHFLGQVLIVLAIAPCLWLASHRIFHGLHDFKIKTNGYTKILMYGIALIGTIAVIFASCLS